MQFMVAEVILMVLAVYMFVHNLQYREMHLFNI